MKPPAPPPFISSRSTSMPSRCVSRSAVPSVLALSTTRIPSGGRDWDCRQSRQRASRSRRLCVTTTAQTVFARPAPSMVRTARSYQPESHGMPSRNRHHRLPRAPLAAVAVATLAVLPLPPIGGGGSPVPEEPPQPPPASADGIQLFAPTSFWNKPLRAKARLDRNSRPL